MIPKLFFLLFFLPVALILPAMSQTSEKKANVAGTVEEKTSGEAVRGVTVALYNDSLRKQAIGVRAAFTNKFGFFSIPNVQPGVYFLFISGIGYETYSQKLVVKGEDIRLDLSLKQKDFRTQEIVVEEKRIIGKPKTTSAIEFSPKYVGRLPSLIGEPDLFRTLQMLPGVQQATELSSGLYVRGGSPDQNLNLLDGVVVYNPSHLGGFLSSFNSDAVRDVRLIKGAFPAEYGGRLSSVLDITMKEGTKEKISGAGGISLISSKLTLEGPLTDNATFMISGRRMYLDLLVDLMTDSDEQVPGYYFYDLNAKANIKLSESDRIFFSGYFGDDVLSGPPDEADFDISWGNATANLRWMHIISNELFTNFSLIYTHYQFKSSIVEDESSKTAFSSLSRIQDIMLRGEAQYFPVKEHVIKAGLELTHHQFDANAASDYLDDIDFIELPANEVGALEAALYIQDEWEVNPLLNTNMGLRLYYFQEGNHFNLEPRLSASYKIGEDMFLKGAFSYVNQTLHLLVRNDLNLPTDIWFPSTETVEPSECLQGVLGFETSFKDGEYYFSAEAYYKYMNNLYEFKDDAEFSFGIPLESQFTSGTGQAYGLELFLNKRIGNLTGWVGYTLAWTERTFPELNNGKPFSPRYDRRHDIKVALIYELGKSWELGATWMFGTGQAYTMPAGQFFFSDVGPGGMDHSIGEYHDAQYLYTERNGSRLPPFHKLDLNFMYKYQWFGIPFALSINIYNVYSRRNPFFWYIDDEWENGEMRKVVKQVTLFPFIPSLGLSFEF